MSEPTVSEPTVSADLSKPTDSTVELERIKHDLRTETWLFVREVVIIAVIVGLAVAHALLT